MSFKMIQLSMVTGQTQDDLEQVTETFTPVWVNVDQIREFYARRHGTGTRISYIGSAGIAVQETPEQVRDAISVVMAG